MLVIGALLAPGAPVQAQEQAGGGADDRPRDRPFQGLFGGDPRRDPEKSLDLLGSLFGGVDTNILANQRVGRTADPGAAAESIVYGANATLSFLRRWERASLNVFASSAVSGYPDVDSDVRAAHTGGLGFTAPLSRRSTFTANGTVALVPFYQLGDLFPSLPSVVAVDVPVATPGFEYSLVKAEALRAEGQAGFTRQVSRHGSLTLEYFRNSTNYFDSENGRFDTVDQRGGGKYTHQVSRYIGIRAGYYYRTGQYGFLQDAEPYRSHDIDVGADYSRAFSFWRRTRFSFSTGSSVVHTAPVGGIAPNEGTRFILTGNASLIREFLRSWSTRVVYRRGVHYLDGFTAPLLSDSVTAAVSGLLARRLQADLSGAVSRGDVGLLSDDRSAYMTWTGRAGLQLAVSRNAAAYVNYVFYHHDFGAGVALPPGVARDLDRNSVRAGVSIWLPVL